MSLGHFLQITSSLVSASCCPQKAAGLRISRPVRQSPQMLAGDCYEWLWALLLVIRGHHRQPKRKPAQSSINNGTHIVRPPSQIKLTKDSS